jgi:hypothetical protein
MHHFSIDYCEPLTGSNQRAKTLPVLVLQSSFESAPSPELVCSHRSLHGLHSRHTDVHSVWTIESSWHILLSVRDTADERGDIQHPSACVHVVRSLWEPTSIRGTNFIERLSLRTVRRGNAMLRCSDDSLSW